MQLNNGKFEYNNKCGYLLKPEIMRRTNVKKSFDPFTESPLDGIVASALKIRVLSGIYLNSAANELKRVGQLVTIELFGLPADTIRGHRAHRVRSLSSNTFNVIYSDPNGFTIKKIIMPQMALLNITVYDEQNKIVGRRFLPVTYTYKFETNKNFFNINFCQRLLVFGLATGIFVLKTSSISR